MEHRSRAAAFLVAVSLLASVLLGATPALAQQPDFTGVWTTYNEPGQAPGGGRGGGPPLPLTDVATQKIARYQTLVKPTGDTPGGFCLGTGMPGSMLGSGGYPMEIHQRPEQIMIVYEAHNEVRRVYLGNRIVPEADRLPGRNGHSSGRWDGNTLVVETTNFTPKMASFSARRGAGGYELGSAEHLRLVERFTRVDARTLQYEFTVNDPTTFTRPFTARFPMNWSDEQIYEYACHEGNYGLTNILKGGRLAEQRGAEDRQNEPGR
jgi:hypothetical protein